MKAQTVRVYKLLTCEYGLMALKNRRLKISVLDKINDPYELRPFTFRDMAHRMAIEATRRDQSRTHGLMCFTSD